MGRTVSPQRSRLRFKSEERNWRQATTPSVRWPKQNGFPVMHVRNRATGESKLIMAQNRAADAKGGSPRLIFRCGDLSGCSLAAIWTTGGYGWELRVPRLSADERERLA